MNPRLTILRKGLILIAVPLLFQVAFIALVAKMRRDGSNAVDWTIHTKDVLAQAQIGRVALLKAHGAIQGYIITREPAFEAEVSRRVAAAPFEIRALRDLVVDREDQTRAASKIERLARDFLGFVDEGRALVVGGRMDAGTASARRLESERLLGELDGEFDRFIAFERQLDAARQGAMFRSRAEMTSLLLAGVAASVVFTILLSIAFSRNISGRISRLTENTRRLAEGRDLLPVNRGGDEIARLDQVFHEMALTLAEAAGREREHAEALGRTAEEMKAINAQLREKAQENEMFVYSVSHDLRSPLVNLQGFSKELQMIGVDLGRLFAHEGVPPEIRRQALELIESDMDVSIGFIQTAVTRLSGIIDGLLRLSRAGQVEYRLQEVEVGPIVARVVDALRNTIDRREAKVSVSNLPAAFGDPAAIEQVFGNLIGNAVNYLDEAQPGRIEVFALEPDEAIAPGSVVYAIRDNGLGIPEAYRAKVFAVFQRLHGDVAKGEGIGLALVRRVVERHGGRIWFESSPGIGTTFFVALPASESTPAAPVDRRAQDPAPPSSRNRNRRDFTWQPSR